MADRQPPHCRTASIRRSSSCKRRDQSESGLGSISLLEASRCWRQRANIMNSTSARRHKPMPLMLHPSLSLPPTSTATLPLKQVDANTGSNSPPNPKKDLATVRSEGLEVLRGSEVRQVAAVHGGVPTIRLRLRARKGYKEF